jgi:hypothetical protein
MTRQVRLLLWVALALGACAPRYSTAGLGQYAEFQPYAVLRGNSIYLELSRAAHVSIIGIGLPNSFYDELPVVYGALYPQYVTDATRFEAGRHRLLSRAPHQVRPMNCRQDERPALDGCRRPFHLLPGVSGVADDRAAYRLGGGGYLVIASAEFIDPFTLAEELFYATLEHPEIAQSLRSGDADATAHELERVLLDRPGSFEWAAMYVTSR